MTYLVDATVLSEPTRPFPTPGVIHWLREHEEALAVDPIVLGELRCGILLLAKGRKRIALQRWFDEGVRVLRCLAWDAETAMAWAALLARLRAAGKAMPVKDSLIAASALVHKLTIVTRHRSDFAAAGVQILDPFDQ